MFALKINAWSENWKLARGKLFICSFSSKSTWLENELLKSFIEINCGIMERPSDELTGKCSVCEEVSKSRCSGCNQVFYCSTDHQRKDWKNHKPKCSPMRVSHNDKIGRYFVATRNIKPGEIVLRESPLVVGPSQSTPPVCVGCLQVNLKFPRLHNVIKKELIWQRVRNWPTNSFSLFHELWGDNFTRTFLFEFRYQSMPFPRFHAKTGASWQLANRARSSQFHKPHECLVDWFHGKKENLSPLISCMADTT